MTLPAGTRLGPYEITGSIGAGGMGEVYRARDTRLDRTVAIKMLPQALSGDPALRQRFEREARVISALDHPHICGLYDVGRDDGRDYLVMQYLEGTTLAARLERGRLPLNEALRIGAQIADALGAAHRRGIVHRDLKPANIMLTPAGARLLDFGLAKGAAIAASVDAGETMAALTAERTIVGTLQYMPPEQVEGRDADARSDIFALGAVLYEMVSGMRAFHGESPASVIAAIMSGEPKPLLDVAPLTPPSLERVIRRCLAKDPEERWQSANDLAFELRSITDARVTPVAAPSSLRAAMIWVGAALLAATAGAAAALMWLPERASQNREIRLTLLPPSGHQFADTIARFDMDLAISPDGSQLAYVTLDPAGTRHLWIRTLASSTARRIAEAEGADRPFWSPDSKSIGFKTDAGICRINLPDGTLQVVAPAAHVDADSKGSWAGGRILFESLGMVGGKRVRGIFSVRESGGTVTPVSVGTRPPVETGQRYPEALPDGQHFIYLSWAAGPNDRAIYLGSFASEERTLLVPSGFRAYFVSPDWLVYVRERALVAQRLDVARRRLVGEPLVIAEQLALEGIPGQAAFAAAGKVVAYRTRTREVESELRWIDRKGNASGPLADRASDISVTLSPDDRLAAVTRLVSSAGEERLPGNIWLFDLTRAVPTRLTLDASRIDENPVWSPDGRRIAHASHRQLALAELWIQNATAPGQGSLLLSRGENFHPIDWSRDGKYILLQGYGTGSGEDDIDLWVVEPREGAQPRPIVKQPLLQAQGQFSPDGRWIAYSSDESGRAEIYIRPFPSGDARTQVSAAGGAQPRWRGDSRELFYVAPDGTVIAVAIGSDGAPGTPVPLFKEASLRVNNYVFFYGGAAGYAVSRDGARFLVNRMTREPSAGPIQMVVDPAALR